MIINAEQIKELKPYIESVEDLIAGGKILRLCWMRSTMSLLTTFSGTMTNPPKKELSFNGFMTSFTIKIEEI